MPRRRKTPLTTTITPSSGGGGSGGTGTSTSAPPFFTLAIEADKPNTVVALDAFNKEIVSLQFDDFNDLISDSFQEYASAAVTAVLGTGNHSKGNTNGNTHHVPVSKHTETDVIHLLDSESSLNSLNSEIEDSIYIQGEDEDENNSQNLDEIFAAVLAENEAARALENLDADLALALRLQEEEEHEKEKEDRRRRANTTGSAWGTLPQNQNTTRPFSAPPTAAAPSTTTTSPDHYSSSVSSFSDIMGTAPGVSVPLNSQKRSSYKVSTEEFPGLPPSARPHTATTTGQEEKNIYNSINSATQYRRDGSVRRSTQRAGTTNNVVGGSGSGGGTGSSGSGDLRSTIEFLDSYDAEAIEARARALQFTQTSTENKTNTATASAAASREKFKKMMDSSSGSKNSEENKEDNGSGYSRRKIRTLVVSMIAAGWEFMPERRGSGHFMYQRFIKSGLTLHKQLLVLPCTPSSQRSIDAVYTRLQRMDREAAALRETAAVENGERKIAMVGDGGDGDGKF
jgi:hypothetical protein